MIGMLVAEETPQITQILQKAVQEIKRINPHARVEFVDYNDYYINKEIAETDAIIEGKI